MTKVLEQLAELIANNFGNVLVPKSDIVTGLLVRSFTKSARRHNLVALKLEMGPRHSKYIESLWRRASPSDHFKFKIDLLKDPRILCWDQKSKSFGFKEISNFGKYPSHYNYSQANYDLKVPGFDKRSLNRLINTRLEQNLIPKSD